VRSLGLSGSNWRRRTPALASLDIIAGQVVGVSRRPRIEDKSFFR
jgi:hypothetical protein